MKDAYKIDMNNLKAFCKTHKKFIQEINETPLKDEKNEIKIKVEMCGYVGCLLKDPTIKITPDLILKQLKDENAVNPA